MQKEHKFADEVERQAKRMRKAEEEKSTIVGQTIYLGTLGLVFVLPVIAGAYLGRWLDGLADGYSLRWTLSLILLGVFIGGLNAYFPLGEG